MTTVPDLLRHLGGAPVMGGANPYYGFWGNDIYFVDYDNGTAGTGGKEIERPQKNLETVLAVAGEWDTIYIRPRDPNTSGGDSNYITPISTTNWTIASTQHGLSLIGTGVGDGAYEANNYQTYLRGSTNAADHVIDISAPFVTLENLAFHRGSADGTAGYNQVAFGGTAFSGTVSRCLFRFHNGTGDRQGALDFDSCWYNECLNSVFYRCVQSITLSATTTHTRCIKIIGNLFVGDGTAGNVNNFINAEAPTKTEYITIADNIFNHPRPTGGDADYYIYLQTGSTGTIVNNTFGTTDVTAATLCNLGSVTFAKNYVSSTNAITSA